jgi:hypothetical protein
MSHAYPQLCGTAGAYQRHLYHKETPCRACTDARAADTARRRKQRRDLSTAATAALFRELLDLITGECRRAGMLP